MRPFLSLDSSLAIRRSIRENLNIFGPESCLTLVPRVWIHLVEILVLRNRP